MRVYTCTPVCFQGDAWFFTRESGLFSKGLAALGIDSMSVMPGPAKEDDKENLLRVPYEQLESSDFWRGLELDGLILYSWAAPRYLPIARAVRNAGIPFLVNVDSCGLVSRQANPHLWWRDLLPYLWKRATSPLEALRVMSQVIDNLGIHRVAKGRLETYEEAAVVCGVSPLATQWLRREAARFSRSHLLPKIRYLPHPQMRCFTYNGAHKENLVLSVARWEKEDWAQKNPAVLLDALNGFLAVHPNWRACVVGRGASRLVAALRRTHLVNLNRCQFIDFLQPEELVPIYNRASIACWSSRSEGQIGTGAQALCCGCSVVAGNSGTLSCFHHYISRESGRLALAMDADSLCEALMLEADAWEAGQRDPERISRIWCEEFHSTKVAERAIRLLELPMPNTLELVDTYP
jgi:glycosyltransferase involved in cell wall biosynthesis